MSTFFVLNLQVELQTLHLSVDLALRMRNLVFSKIPCFICESANLRIGGSTCWSSPTLIVTSVTVVICSFSAICLAEDRIASANAHSCIEYLSLSNFKRILRKNKKIYFVRWLDLNQLIYFCELCPVKRKR